MIRFACGALFWGKGRDRGDGKGKDFVFCFFLESLEEVVSPLPGKKEEWEGNREIYMEKNIWRGKMLLCVGGRRRNDRKVWSWVWR